MSLAVSEPSGPGPECADEASLVASLSNFPKPFYSKKQVVRAGQALAGDLPWDPAKGSDQYTEIFKTAWDWRNSHAYPMRRLRVDLSGKIRRVKANGITAGRMKRMSSIRKKLRRISTMSLTQIQDIGGCRAIVDSIADLNGILAIYRNSGTQHVLRTDTSYIDRPKPGGYRSHHLVFEFKPTVGGEEVYEGRRIEMQLRTRLQHAWATAVEAVGLVRNEDTKAGEGDKDWLRLFELVSSEFAVAEGCPIGPDIPDKAGRLAEVKALDAKLNAVRTLENLNQALKYSEQFVGHESPYFLIQYDNDRHTVDVRPYGIAIGAELYGQVESAGGKKTTVLVEVDKVANLKEAYPNYFLDVRLFTKNLVKMIDGRPLVTLLREEPPEEANKAVTGYEWGFLRDWMKPRGQ